MIIGKMDEVHNNTCLLDLRKNTNWLSQNVVQKEYTIFNLTKQSLNSSSVSERLELNSYVT